MRSSCRFALAALCSTLLTAPVSAGIADFEWAPQAQSETVGTPRDPGERAVAIRDLQRELARHQVDRALRAPAVVELTATESARVNDVTRREMKYLVGVAKPAGITVDLAAAGRLGNRTKALAFGAARGTGDGGFVWTGALRSPGASAMRLHITGLDLPPGAQLFVYNSSGHAFGPYTGRGPLGTGELHTHTVFGDELLLQLRADRGAGRIPAFTIEQIGVMGSRFLAPRNSPFAGDDDGDLRSKLGASFCSYNADCVENADCQSHSAVNAAKDAVASMLFLSGGSYYICTGGLLADTNTNDSPIPYFLTANHCISKGSEASSLETYFDYQTSCSSPNCAQPYNSTGDTVGATILRTSSTSDYTLLRLSSTPQTADGVTTYLGWNSAPVANSHGTNLYRISHPAGAPQAYSEHRVDTTKGTCRSWPRGNWIYSQDIYGATEGGSSGSPVVNGSGQVVGQLSGACGFNPSDACDDSNATVDGAFAAYYSAVAQWLDPSSGGGGGGGGSCSPKGASCTSNSECCSGKCNGPNGRKKCK